MITLFINNSTTIHLYLKINLILKKLQFFYFCKMDEVKQGAICIPGSYNRLILNVLIMLLL